MDNYPNYLAPEFEECGGVATPFDEWWLQVNVDFPTVPEDVARHWLHEHWNHSPFSWLPSRDYRFEPQDWPIENLSQIRSRWDNFSEGGRECREHGDHLQTLKSYQTSQFIILHGVPPAALVVLDNRDGHLSAHAEALRANIPHAYVLVEGHRRFNLCLSLTAQGGLKRCPVWLMTQSA